MNPNNVTSRLELSKQFLNYNNEKHHGVGIKNIYVIFHNSTLEFISFEYPLAFKNDLLLFRSKFILNVEPFPYFLWGLPLDHTYHSVTCQIKNIFYVEIICSLYKPKILIRQILDKIYKNIYNVDHKTHMNNITKKSRKKYYRK